MLSNLRINIPLANSSTNKYNPSSRLKTTSSIKSLVLLLACCYGFGYWYRQNPLDYTTFPHWISKKIYKIRVKYKGSPQTCLDISYSPKVKSRYSLSTL